VNESRDGRINESGSGSPGQGKENKMEKLDDYGELPRNRYNPIRTKTIKMASERVNNNEREKRIPKLGKI